jgi:hypothetical protein
MRPVSSGGGVAGKTFRFSKVAMNSRFHSTKREMRMRAARGFIKFKIQNSNLKIQGREEGKKRSEVRGQRAEGGQEREILNFEF